MTSAFDRTDGFPLSVLGPGYSRGGPQQALSPSMADAMSRGTIPILTSENSLSVANSLGRMGATWVPGRVALDVFDRGANYSPVDAITGQAVITAGSATITLAAPSAFSGTLISPAYRGHDYRFAGLCLDISTSMLTVPGNVTVSIDGYFEDLLPYTQTLVLSPGLIGVARYYLIFSQQTQGGSYPALVTIQSDMLAAPPGVSMPVTVPGEGGITSITFTNGIRSANYGLNLAFQGLDNTGLTATLLSPSTALWDAAYSRWLAAGFRPMGGG